MNSRDALNKIDNTICIAYNTNNDILFNKDPDDHCDCASIEEFVECYDAIDKDLGRIEELEAKAKAFDVLRRKLWLYEFYITHKIDLIFSDLTDEECEILKKAGVE